MTAAFRRSCRLACCVCLILLPHAAAGEESLRPAWSSQGLFATQERRFDNAQDFPKWNGVLSRQRRSLAAGCPEADPPCPDQRWWRMLRDLGGRPPRQQVQGVQETLNRIRHVSDRDNWGVEDYWESPGEFMAKGGDCEDFAIAKFFALRQLGFGGEDLRLVIVRDQAMTQPHAVLAVRLDGTWLLLDSLRDAVIDAAEARNYRPVYSMNETSWWLHQGPRWTLAANSAR